MPPQLIRLCLAVLAPAVWCGALACGAPTEMDTYTVYPHAVVMTSSGALAYGPVTERGEVAVEVSAGSARTEPGAQYADTAPAPNQINFRVAAGFARRLELNWVANVAPFAGVPTTNLERNYGWQVEMRDRPGALFDMHWGMRVRLSSHPDVDAGLLVLTGLETSWAAKAVRTSVFDEGYRVRPGIQGGFFAGGHVGGPLSLMATVTVETGTEAHPSRTVTTYSADRAASRVPALNQFAAFTTGLDAELRFNSVALSGTIYSVFGYGSRSVLPSVAGRAGIRYYFGRPRSAPALDPESPTPGIGDLE